MDYIEPELRENQGEIEAALKHQLPKIIGYNDIKGDLHCHSNWDGGTNSIEEIAEMAIKMGYQYVGISDHTLPILTYLTSRCHIDLRQGYQPQD